ncbi:MAG TPA: NUDIX hydrolase [Fodinibius sp.]|nr:NUDIX hydrolase [Fodinibius sp.]
MSLPELFSGRLRLRACGVLVEKGQLLAVNLRSPVTDQMIWIPPGGEVEFGESLKEAVKREFAEETKVRVQVHGLLHVEELIRKEFHAVECYFEVSRIAGEPELGSDPELEDHKQLLQKVDWLPISDLSHFKVVPQRLVSKLKDWENRSLLQLGGH